MLRTIFVITLLVVGWGLALKGPLEGLLLYLWLAYFRPEMWLWSDLLHSAPLSYAAGVYVVLRSVLSGVQFRFDLRIALLLLILLHSTLSTFLSTYSEYSSYFWRDFAKSLLISYLIAVLATDISRLRLIVLVMCMSLAFEAAKQGWVQLLFNPGGTNINPVPFLGDNNAVAVGMLMLVALLVALGQTTQRRWERWLHYGLAVGVLYRAISTYSRGGFLAAGVLGLLFLIRSKHKWRAFIAGAAAATITLSVLPDQFWERMETIAVSKDEERDESSASRLHFWEIAVQMANDHPVFGVGHNAYNRAYNGYDFSHGRYGTNRSVHSAWFGVWSELGYVGLVLFVANIALALIACRRARRLAKRGQIRSEFGAFAVAIETALLVFAVGGSFVIFQYTEMLWHVIGLSIALHFLTQHELAGQATRAGEEQPTLRPAPSLAAAAAFRQQ